jgi:hypothetical protein
MLATPDQDQLQAGGTAIGQDAAARLVLPVGRSGYAIAAGYLALFSVVPFLGMVLAPLTIIFAVMAHKRIRANPQLHGMGRVIFAYILGGLALLANLAIVTVLVVAFLKKE